ERSIRLLVSRRLVSIHGTDWSGSVLGHLGDRALSAARRDMSGVGTQVNEVPLPLDWLTLEDLFQLAGELASKDELGGMSTPDWDRLAQSVVPIRNRVSHMRLPRAGDLDKVRQANRLVQVRASRAESVTQPISERDSPTLPPVS